MVRVIRRRTVREIDKTHTHAKKKKEDKTKTTKAYQSV